MEESNILIGLIGLVIGAAIGYFWGRSSTTDTSQEQKVESLQKEIEDYKASVSSHFQQTASMISEMNDSYKGVIQHLASGSQDLCDAGTARDIESKLPPKLTADSPAVEESSSPSAAASAVEPPRDYAPKRPDEEGALSENYGIQNIKSDNKEADEEVPTPPSDGIVKP